jgi:hypothetical protein
MRSIYLCIYIYCIYIQIHASRDVHASTRNISAITYCIYIYICNLFTYAYTYIVYIYKYMRAETYMRAHATYLRLLIVPIYLSIYLSIYLCNLFTYAYTYIVYIYKYIIYICMCVCMYVCMYVCSIYTSYMYT